MYQTGISAKHFLERFDSNTKLFDKSTRYKKMKNTLPIFAAAGLAALVSCTDNDGVKGSQTESQGGVSKLEMVYGSQGGNPGGVLASPTVGDLYLPIDKSAPSIATKRFGENIFDMPYKSISPDAVKYLNSDSFVPKSELREL